MKHYFTCLSVLALAGCQVPAPAAYHSVDRTLDGDLGSEVVIAVDAEAATETEGPGWAYPAEDAAKTLEDKLRFLVLNSDLVTRAVYPEDEATHEMLISITSFQHEAAAYEDPGEITEGRDGFNEMTADIKILDRVQSEELMAYSVEALAGTEEKFGKNAPGLIGVDALLNAAAAEIVNGFHAAATGPDT